jgi:hypothetical protein
MWLRTILKKSDDDTTEEEILCGVDVTQDDGLEVGIGYMGVFPDVGGAEEMDEGEKNENDEMRSGKTVDDVEMVGSTLEVKCGDEGGKWMWL